MTTEVRVPTLGESVTEATVATWFKKPGDAVAADEMLCELETDKVTVEVPAEHSAGFAFASHVACRAEARPRSGAIAVPAIFVHEGEEGLLVQRGGALAPVKGSRYDQHVVVSEGVTPGELVVVRP